MNTQWNCIMLAGVGGTMPTLSRLASTYVTDPAAPLPEIGLFVGVGLFFIIGSVLAFAFSESNIRQAFIIGVCAPGIITNIVAGVQDANLTVAGLDSSSLFPSAAIAQEKIPSNRNLTKPSDIEPVLILKNNVISGTSWDIKKTFYTVSATLNNGETKTLGRFPSSNFQQELRIPKDSNRIQIQAGKYTKRINLPEEPYSSLIINCRFVYSGNKNDFLWALGAKRASILKNFNADIVKINWVDNSVSIKSILGKSVSISPTHASGVLDDIKINSDGRVGMFKIRVDSGKLISVSPISIMVSDSIVRLTVAHSDAGN